MAEEIRLDVVAVGHNRGLDDTSRALRGVKADSDKTAKSFKDTADATFDLDQAVGEARVEIARLNEEFKRTGDRSILKSIREQQRDLDAVMKIAGGAASAGGAGIDFGGAGMRPRSALIGIAAGSIAILSPMIGAAIAGAVTGAVGLGGIIGGVASAAKDPAVKSAAKQFGADISKEFFQGEAFVQPVVDSLGILKEAFVDLNLDETFGKTAPFLTDLAEGIGGFAREFGESFSNVLDRSSEIIPAVSAGIERLGDGLGSMIEEMASSDGTIEGIIFLFEALAETAHVVGVSIKFLGDQFSSIGRFSARLSGQLEDIATALPGVEGDNIFSRINDDLERVTGTSDEYVSTLTKVITGTTTAGGAAAGASGSWSAYAGQVKIAADHQQDLNQAIEDSISNMLAQDNANLGLKQAMADFSETLKGNGRNWDTNTEKGRANSQGLLHSVQAAERKRQADIKMGIQMGLSAEEAAARANTAYNKTIRKLEDMARKAGISEKALKDLVGDYYINIHVKQTGSFFQHSPKLLEAKGRATGGPVGPGTYVVGERGPEVLQLGQGSRGHVYPSVGAFAGSRGGGSRGGSGRVILDLQINGRTVRTMAIDDAIGRGVARESILVAYP